MKKAKSSAGGRAEKPVKSNLLDKIIFHGDPFGLVSLRYMIRFNSELSKADFQVVRMSPEGLALPRVHTLHFTKEFGEIFEEEDAVEHAKRYLEAWSYAIGPLRPKRSKIMLSQALAYACFSNMSSFSSSPRPVIYISNRFGEPE